MMDIVILCLSRGSIHTLNVSVNIYIMYEHFSIFVHVCHIINF